MVSYFIFIDISQTEKKTFLATRMERLGCGTHAIGPVYITEYIKCNHYNQRVQHGARESCFQLFIYDIIERIALR